ncbi:hypothetical protein RclHR1_17690006 [Rhizophagus clarus]|uniref:BTB/POZ protein n=1 Tax=Rhizophagus clarus TaxID=94130 RepID=A0A2Z6QPJ7_9GLOM|nr:hypothetical protein RclHR1_17690006 [Rhizophagus clarus]GES96154.1 BTB/POZ protein [Rhizophagus clarus]
MKESWFKRTFRRRKNVQDSFTVLTTASKIETIDLKDTQKQGIIGNLSDDIGKLLETSENYDVIIYAGEENQEDHNVQEFKTHSQILSARSPYFRAELSSNRVKKEDNIFIFKKSNIPPDIFKILLVYLYAGTIELENTKSTDILKILIAADELGLQKLINYTQSYLIGKKSEFLRNDPVQILQTVFHNEGHVKLRDFCLETICNDPEILFYKEDLLNLDEHLFLMLIKRDTLRLEELEIWKDLIRWAIAQCSLTINIHQSQNWTKENFDIIRETIKNFIPHIRWFQIPADEFWREIRPFEDLLPEDLYQDIIGYHLDPETTLSTMILPILPKRIAPL